MKNFRVVLSVDIDTEEKDYLVKELLKKYFKDCPTSINNQEISIYVCDVEYYPE